MKEYGALNLLTALIWGEARGESYDGKCAVAFVARNRVDDKRWPNTIEDVILQPKQFSCFNEDGPNYQEIIKTLTPSRNGNWESMDYRECRSAAHLVLGNWRKDITGGANHYHNWRIMPYWADGMKITAIIGEHKFYNL